MGRYGGVIDIASFLQTPPYTYTFTVIITDPDNKWDETSCFVDWPTDLHSLDGMP